MNKILLLILIVCCAALSAFGQNKITRDQYINKYKDISIKEMKEFGIPASITLAQGILESDNGNSTLARKAKNHFGIKCHSSWTGSTFTHDDDRPNECFRKYKSAEQSFYDHSKFLIKHKRYALLFDFKITDYKSWAKGLKKAGYATNSKYDKLLVKIIEENRLYIYDNKKYKQTTPNNQVEPVEYLADDVDDYAVNPFGENVLYENRIDYIVVKEGDSFEAIAQKHGVRAWQLYKYNELTNGVQPVEGQRIYLQPKRKKADVKYKNHTVKAEESMYSISQQYGIKLKSLYKINSIELGAQPEIGTKLSLRKKVKK